MTAWSSMVARLHDLFTQSGRRERNARIATHALDEHRTKQQRKSGEWRSRPVNG